MAKGAATIADGGSATSSIRALVVDMDGTLFTSDHRITPRTVAVLQRLKTMGIVFLVATGRPYGDVFPTLADAGLQPDFIITSNGSRIHESSHAVLREHNIDPAAAHGIFQLAKPHVASDLNEAVSAVQGPGNHPLLCNVNCGGDWLTNCCIAEVRRCFHASFAHEEVDPSGVTVERLEGTHSIWLRGTSADLLAAQRFIAAHFADRVSTAFALPFILDCFPCGVDKGVAVTEVCQYLGLDTASVVAFGDGMNDVQMLQVAGRGFLMGNAANAVKAALPNTEVIERNDDDGVARKLEELLAIGAFS